MSIPTSFIYLFSKLSNTYLKFFLNPDLYNILDLEKVICKNIGSFYDAVNSTGTAETVVPVNYYFYYFYQPEIKSFLNILDTNFYFIDNMYWNLLKSLYNKGLNKIKKELTKYNIDKTIKYNITFYNKTKNTLNTITYTDESIVRFILVQLLEKVSEPTDLITIKTLDLYSLYAYYLTNSLKVVDNFELYVYSITLIY